MQIKQIFLSAKKWLWLIFLGIILGGSLGYYFSNRQTPIYQATTRFVIMRAFQSNYDYYAYMDNQQQINTYAQLLSTDDLLQRAANELGMIVRKGQASAAQIGDTNFVLLTVKDEDPYRAAAIANGLVKVLIEQNEELQSIRYDTAETNILIRISEAETQINLLEEQISTMSTEAVQDQISVVQSQMDDLQGQINTIKQNMADISPVSVVNDGAASTSPTDTHNLTDDQQSQLVAYQNELDELSPILALYQDIYTQLVVLGKSADGGTSTPAELIQLNTTLDLYQQIYISSISSLENLSLAKAQNTPTVVQVDAAVKPISPISPKPVQTALISAAVGLIVTVGIAFLVEVLDDTLKTPDDVKVVLDVPVIGYVGDLHQKDQDKNGFYGMYVARNPRSPVAEAFRALRTNLEYSSVDNPIKSILVTSSGESEGKSTIAANLAIVQAQSGKRVLIVDSDMRRPKIHAQFNKPNRIGLSDLVTGKMQLHEVVKKCAQVDGLDIITCGTLPPNPSELLGSERMTKILREMEENYDFVVFDSPPTVVSDAQIMSTKVDGIIYVIIPGKTRALAAQRPLVEMERIDAKVLGVVVNRIPRNRDYYYGGYSYYSPYTSHSYYHSPKADEEEEPKSPKPKVIPIGQIFNKYRRKDKPTE